MQKIFTLMSVFGLLLGCPKFSTPLASTTIYAGSYEYLVALESLRPQSLP